VEKLFNVLLLELKEMTRIITVISGKGGVGKTTAVTNIGAAMQAFGKDVLVIDGNITTPNISLQLGLAGAKQTLHDVLRDEANVQDVVYLHPPSKMKVIPAGLSIKDLKSKFGKTIEDVVLELMGMTDIILIDASAGLGEEAKYAIEAGDEIIVITNPELPAVTDALKAVEISKRAGKKPIGVVVNKHTGAKHELKPSNISSFLDLPILSVVPDDTNVKKSLNIYTPVVLSYPESDAAIEFKRIAAKLVGNEYVPLIKKGVWFKLKKFLKRRQI